jgi:UDP-N-acetylglucosamine--N-acetylmuramyl-(pentapeptide) pyrophosphoryl-undecaprenol N-acetylglucosamine transferase
MVELSQNLTKRVKITGNPLLDSVFHKAKTDIDFTEKLPLLFVTGGNQGSNTINWRLFKILPELLKTANIVHQVGDSTITDDLKKAALVKASLPKELQTRYKFFPYLYEQDFAAMMQQADLVLSRAGANTVCTLLALGKLSVLIPIPWSEGNEQVKNAELLAKTGLGLILKQYDAMPPDELLSAINKGLKAAAENKAFNGHNLEQAKLQAEKKNSRDAAAQIIDAILS